MANRADLVAKAKAGLAFLDQHLPEWTRRDIGPHVELAKLHVDWTEYRNAPLIEAMNALPQSGDLQAKGLDVDHETLVLWTVFELLCRLITCGEERVSESASLALVGLYGAPEVADLRLGPAIKEYIEHELEDGVPAADDEPDRPRVWNESLMRLPPATARNLCAIHGSLCPPQVDKKGVVDPSGDVDFVTPMLRATRLEYGQGRPADDELGALARDLIRAAFADRRRTPMPLSRTTFDWTWDELEMEAWSRREATGRPSEMASIWMMLRGVLLPIANNQWVPDPMRGLCALSIIVLAVRHEGDGNEDRDSAIEAARPTFASYGPMYPRHFVDDLDPPSALEPLLTPLRSDVSQRRALANGARALVRRVRGIAGEIQAHPSTQRGSIPEDRPAGDSSDASLPGSDSSSLGDPAVHSDATAEEWCWLREARGIWRIQFGGTSRPVPHTAGMLAIGLLLDAPTREFQAKELLQPGNAAPAVNAKPADAAGPPVTPLIDQQTVNAVRREIEELEEAPESPARDEKIAKLKQYLLDGHTQARRPRPELADQRRLNQRVRMQIERARKKVAEVNEELALHLRTHVVTRGPFSYRPPHGSPQWLVVGASRR